MIRLSWMYLAKVILASQKITRGIESLLLGDWADVSWLEYLARKHRAYVSRSLLRFTRYALQEVINKQFLW